MNRIKYSLIFILPALVIMVSGCGIFPPPFFTHSHSHSDRHRDREERKVYINSKDDFGKRHHDNIKKLKIRIMNEKDSLDEKLNQLHEKLEHMNIKIDSLNKELIIVNDSLANEFDIEINLDKLDEMINTLVEDLDREIELSINADMAHPDEQEINEIEDFDIDNENFNIKVEEIDGEKVMKIKYYDDESDEWKEIKISLPH